MHRPRAEIAVQHFRVALEAAAGEDHGVCAHCERPVSGPDAAHTYDGAVVGHTQAVDRRFMADDAALGDNAGTNASIEREAAAIGADARLYRSREWHLQRNELHAERLDPGDRVGRFVRQRRDHVRVDEASCPGRGRPGLRIARGLRDDRRIEVTARVAGEMLLEILRHLSRRLHAHPRAGVACVPAKLVLRRAVQDAHACALLLCRKRRGKPCSTATDDDHVEIARCIHHLPPVPFRSSLRAAPAGLNPSTIRRSRPAPLR